MEKNIEEKPIERIKDKPFLTITEAAIYLGVTRTTIYGYIKRGGGIKGHSLGFKYLLKKKDIDELFNNPTEFHTPTKEEAPITDIHSTSEVKKKYHVNESWIFAVPKKHNIPRTFNRGKTYWSKKHIDAYFAKKVPNPNDTGHSATFRNKLSIPIDYLHCLPKMMQIFLRYTSLFLQLFSITIS